MVTLREVSVHSCIGYHFMAPWRLVVRQLSLIRRPIATIKLTSWIRVLSPAAAYGSSHFKKEPKHFGAPGLVSLHRTRLPSVAKAWRNVSQRLVERGRAGLRLVRSRRQRHSRWKKCYTFSRPVSRPREVTVSRQLKGFRPERWAAAQAHPRPFTEDHGCDMPLGGYLTFLSKWWHGSLVKYYPLTFTANYLLFDQENSMYTIKTWAKHN